MDLNHSVDRLCMGCMGMRETEGVCPYCGFDETAHRPAPHHLPPRTILGGKYLVGRVLGEGGFGITYLGWDLNLDLKLAVKEFYPTGFVTRENTTTNTVTPFTGEKEEFFRTGRDRFVEEAKRLAKFYALPGIVSVKDFFLENGTAYIVMEYVDGQTLKERIVSAGGKLPTAQVFERMRPLIGSLSEIHKSGIIHRDISPDNIMLTKEGNVKLLDFGAARDFSQSGNKSLSVMLKPGYAPEEQYRTRGVQGPWTDVYALCATMYRAITGITPDESCERVQNDEVKRPSQLGIAIPPQQEDVLMKGMAVLQKDRIQSMEELSAALYSDATVVIPHPEPGPIPPVPPSPGPVPNPDWKKKLEDFYNKNKKAVLIGAACIVVVLVLIAAFAPRNGSRQASAQTTLNSSSAGLVDRENGTVTIGTYGNKFLSGTLPDEIKKEFPNVTVKTKSYSISDYESALKTDLAAGEAPDLFIVVIDDQSDDFYSNMAGGGYLTDLSGLTAWSHVDSDSAQAYDGKYYAVPLTGTIGLAVSQQSGSKALCEKILNLLYDGQSSLSKAREDYIDSVTSASSEDDSSSYGDSTPQTDTSEDGAVSESQKAGIVEYYVNSVKHTMYAISPVSSGSCWCAEFYPEDDPDTSTADSKLDECLLLNFPLNVSSGTQIADSVSSIDPAIGYRMQGYSDVYIFPTDYGNGYTSTCTINMEDWDGSGGYCYGTFSAEIRMNDGSVVDITDGAFSARIE